MRNIVFKLVGVILTAALCGHAFAGGNNTGQVDTSFLVMGTHGLLVKLKSTTLATDNDDCDGTGNLTADTVALVRTNPDFNELYAAIMLGHADDRLLGFWVDGCDSSVPGGPSPAIKSVYIY